MEKYVFSTCSVQSRFERWEEVVTPKPSDPQESSLLQELFIGFDVGVYLVLPFEMRDQVFSARDGEGVGESRPDVVFQCWSLRSGFGDVDSLSCFCFDG